MITADNLAEAPGVKHMFFTRQGGVSDGIYASLNCGPGSSDERARVIDNRARAMAALDQEPANLVTVYQYHSPVVVEVHTPWAAGEALKADAMVTEPTMRPMPSTTTPARTRTRTATACPTH